jgi:hypothetical protein
VKQFLLPIAVILLLASCKKQGSKHIFTFEQASGMYDYDYVVADSDNHSTDTCILRVAADGTITESRTTSGNKWAAHLTYVETPESELYDQPSYFTLEAISTNSDYSKAFAVKAGNDGYFISGPFSPNGKRTVYWKHEKQQIIAALRP